MFSLPKCKMHTSFVILPLWKYSTVKLAQRSQKLLDCPFSYRPINQLLQYLSKLFEKSLLKRLLLIVDVAKISPTINLVFAIATVYQTYFIINTSWLYILLYKRSILIPIIGSSSVYEVETYLNSVKNF